MRTIKLVVVSIILFALMLIIAANWTPVDLRLVPKAFGFDFLTWTQVPLALVVAISALGGFVIAMLLEMIRNIGVNRKMEQKRREIGKLRQENARLAEKLGVSTAEEMALGLQ